MTKGIETISEVLSRIIYIRAKGFMRKLLDSTVDMERHRKEIKNAAGNYALYVHIPFCHVPLCKFCCFVRYPYNESAAKSYYSALLAEVSQLFSLAEKVKIDVVYIGGGTPSINPQLLAELIDSLYSTLGKGLQISVEANPSNVNEDFISLLRNKVARLSLGVQALDDERLSKLGRFSSKSSNALEAVSLAKGKFKTLNIDMIWAAPGDNPEIVREEAQKALSLGAQQVTFYPLMPSPETWDVLKAQHSGPWSPNQYEMYKAIIFEAKKYNYSPSSPWCMNKGSELVDEYIIDYDKYFAVGLSGIARIGGYVYANDFSVNGYIKKVTQNKLSASLSSYPTKEEDALYLADSMLFGLRWCPSVLQQKFGSAGELLSSIINSALKALGENIDGSGCSDLKNLQTLYILNVAQRSLYTALSWFRKEAIKIFTAESFAH